MAGKQKKSDAPDRWIRTDEEEDVAGSIRHAVRCANGIASDEQAWKWFALAIHSALQGACICHLVTTAVPVGVVDKKNTAEWLRYFEESRSNPAAKPPSTRLKSLPDLLKAIRKSNSAGDRSNDQGVKLSDRELQWLKRFHNGIRNEFVHFSPKGWSIEVSGLPDLAKLTARLIEDMLNIGWAFRHKSARWKRALRADLQRLSNLSI